MNISAVDRKATFAYSTIMSESGEWHVILNIVSTSLEDVAPVDVVLSFDFVMTTFTLLETGRPACDSRNSDDHSCKIGKKGDSSELIGAFILSGPITEEHVSATVTATCQLANAESGTTHDSSTVWLLVGLYWCMLIGGIVAFRVIYHRRVWHEVSEYL